jgi:hypothetical protein
MDKQRSSYQSYLLRLWRANGSTDRARQGEPVWRASLEDPLTGERMGFASLDDLVAYLRQATDAQPGPQAGDG